MSEYKIPRSITNTKKRRHGRRRRRLRKTWKMILAGAAVLVLLLLALCLKACFFSGSSEKQAAAKTVSEETQLAEESLSEDSSEEVSEGASEEAETGTEEAVSEEAAPAEVTAAETTAAAVSFVGELPDIDVNSWEFVLINAKNPVDKSFAPTVAKYEGIQIDERVLPALQEFVEAARAQNLKVYLSSAYRDYAWQSSLFNKKLKQGYSRKKAATIVAEPGTSEHQSGLAADITDVKRKKKTSALEKTDTYQWMSAHCQEYGFIVRFPNDKSDITGIIYEPWHFRYVGKEAATFIMANGLCLEEFLDLYKTETAQETTVATETAADNSI